MKSKIIITKQSYFWLAAGSILCLGIYLRLMGLGKGIWLDEGYSLYIISSKSFIHRLLSLDHPPLYFILLKTWSKINNGEEFLRLFSVLLGTGTIALGIKWIKPYSHFGSLVAGLIVATLPMMLQYSQEIRGYSLLVFAFTLSLYYASRITGKSEKRFTYVALSFSLCIAVATHAVGIMFIISTGLFILILSPRLNTINLKRLLFTFTIPVCLFLLQLYFLPGLRKSIKNWWVPEISAGWLLYILKELSGIEQTRQLYWLSVETFPGLTDFVIAIVDYNIDVILFAGFITVIVYMGNRRHIFPFFIAALSYWGQLVLYSIFVIPVLISRTALPGIIPFIALIGIQLATIKKQKLKIVVTSATILLCILFTLNWIKNEAGKPPEDWKKISGELTSIRNPGDIILVYPDFIHFTLNYYAGLPVDKVITIPSEPDIKELERNINYLLSHQNGIGSFSVFLIVRNFDTTIYPEAYQQILNLLTFYFGEPMLLRKFTGDLLLIKYKYRKLNQ